MDHGTAVLVSATEGESNAGLSDAAIRGDYEVCRDIQPRVGVFLWGGYKVKGVAVGHAGLAGCQFIQTFVHLASVLRGHLVEDGPDVAEPSAGYLPRYRAACEQHDGEPQRGQQYIRDSGRGVYAVRPHTPPSPAGCPVDNIHGVEVVGIQECSPATATHGKLDEGTPARVPQSHEAGPARYHSRACTVERIQQAHDVGSEVGLQCGSNGLELARDAGE